MFAALFRSGGGQPLRNGSGTGFKRRATVVVGCFSSAAVLQIKNPPSESHDPSSKCEINEFLLNGLGSEIGPWAKSAQHDCCIVRPN